MGESRDKQQPDEVATVTDWDGADDDGPPGADENLDNGARAGDGVGDDDDEVWGGADWISDLPPRDGGTGLDEDAAEGARLGGPGGRNRQVDLEDAFTDEGAVSSMLNDSILRGSEDVGLDTATGLDEPQDNERLLDTLESPEWGFTEGSEPETGFDMGEDLADLDEHASFLDRDQGGVEGIWEPDFEDEFDSVSALDDRGELGLDDQGTSNGGGDDDDEVALPPMRGEGDSIPPAPVGRDGEGHLRRRSVGTVAGGVRSLARGRDRLWVAGDGLWAAGPLGLRRVATEGLPEGVFRGDGWCLAAVGEAFVAVAGPSGVFVARDGRHYHRLETSVPGEAAVSAALAGGATRPSPALVLSTRDDELCLWLVGESGTFCGTAPIQGQGMPQLASVARPNDVPGRLRPALVDRADGGLWWAGEEDGRLVLQRAVATTCDAPLGSRTAMPLRTPIPSSVRRLWVSSAPLPGPGSRRAVIVSGEAQPVLIGVESEVAAHTDPRGAWREAFGPEDRAAGPALVFAGDGVLHAVAVIAAGGSLGTTGSPPQIAWRRFGATDSIDHALAPLGSALLCSIGSDGGIADLALAPGEEGTGVYLGTDRELWVVEFCRNRGDGAQGRSGS